MAEIHHTKLCKPILEGDLIQFKKELKSLNLYHENKFMIQFLKVFKSKHIDFIVESFNLSCLNGKEEIADFLMTSSDLIQPIKNLKSVHSGLSKAIYRDEYKIVETILKKYENLEELLSYRTYEFYRAACGKPNMELFDILFNNSKHFSILPKEQHYWCFYWAIKNNNIEKIEQLNNLPNFLVHDSTTEKENTIFKIFEESFSSDISFEVVKTLILNFNIDKQEAFKNVLQREKNNGYRQYIELIEHFCAKKSLNEKLNTSYNNTAETIVKTKNKL